VKGPCPFIVTCTKGMSRRISMGALCSSADDVRERKKTRLNGNNDQRQLRSGIESTSGQPYFGRKLAELVNRVSQPAFIG